MQLNPVTGLLGLLESLQGGGVFSVGNDLCSLGRWASLSFDTTPMGDCGGQWVSGPVRSWHYLLQLGSASTAILSEVSEVQSPGSAAVDGVG